MTPWHFFRDLSSQVERVTGSRLTIRATTPDYFHSDNPRIVANLGHRAIPTGQEYWLILNALDFKSLDVSMMIFRKRQTVVLHLFNDRTNTHEWVRLPSNPAQEAASISTDCSAALRADKVVSSVDSKATAGESSAVLQVSGVWNNTPVTRRYEVTTLTPAPAEVAWAEAEFISHFPGAEIQAQNVISNFCRLNQKNDAKAAKEFWVYLEGKPERCNADQVRLYWNSGQINFAMLVTDAEQKWKTPRELNLV